MKTLLLITTLIEVPAGLALLIVPALVVRLLLGSELPDAGIPLGRLAGVALLALGAACWRASGETKSRTARGLVAAMLLYNLGAVVILVVAGIQSQKPGIALWPAVILHAAMTAWCVASLRRKPARIEP